MLICHFDTEVEIANRFFHCKVTFSPLLVNNVWAATLKPCKYRATHHAPSLPVLYPLEF